MSPFAQTIGHKTAQDVLLRLFANDRTPHALLFVGPSHVGKTHLATALIRHLLRVNLPLEISPDVTFVHRERDEKTGKRKAQISVKQIRFLTQRLAMSSMGGSWKIGFIEEANLLSTGAANALLKTLEEPKGKTLLLLCAPSVESVLPTIASRCQCVRLAIVSRIDLSLALQKRGLGRHEAHQIASRCLGRPGLALRFLQDSELRAQKELAHEYARTLFSASLPEQFRSVQDLIPKSEIDKSPRLLRLLDDWSEVLRDEFLRSIGCESWCFEAEEGRKEQRMTREHQRRVLLRIQEVREALSHNINPHLALEHLFL